MKKIIAALVAACGISAAQAGEGPVPGGIPQLDHVFVIMMENHGYSQIIYNPNAPFTNSYALVSMLCFKYYAIAHPSLSNTSKSSAARTSVYKATTTRIGTTSTA